MSDDSHAGPADRKRPRFLRPPSWEGFPEHLETPDELKAPDQTFPDELEAPDRPQWVLWRARWKEGKNGKPGRWAKVPYLLPCVDHGGAELRKARTNAAGPWLSYVEAAWAATQFSYSEDEDGEHMFDGVGFVFTEKDHYVGIDLDHAVDSAGTIEPWAQKILDHFRSYAEFSVSGHGIHTIIKGKLPEHVRHKKKCGTCEIEVYDKLRYFTMSGHVVPGTSGAHINERQAELDSFLREYEMLPAQSSAPPQLARAAVNEPQSPPTVNEPQALPGDEEILAKARAAKNGAKFAALYDGGHIADYDNDDSRADFALCSMLAFWTGPDAGAIDRLFRRSKLMRPKWDRRDGQFGTYGARTIAKVLEDKTEFYDWGKGHPLCGGGAPGTGSGFSTTPEAEGIPAEPARINGAEAEPDRPHIASDVPADLAYTETWLARKFVQRYPNEFRFRQADNGWERCSPGGGYWQYGMQAEVSRLITSLNLEYSNQLKAEADEQRAKKKAGEMVERDPNSLIGMSNHVASAQCTRAVEQLLRSMLSDRPLDAAARPGLMADQIEARMPQWLWRGHLLRERVALLEGDPAFGKSLITIDLAARISTGAGWPDGTPGTGVGHNAIIISSEDDKETIQARLAVAGADLRRIRIISAKVGEGRDRQMLYLPEDCPMLAATAKEDSAVLIVLDTITSFLSRRLNPNLEPDVRQLYVELEDLGAQSGATILGLRHLKKDTTVTSALYRGLGSIAWSAAARTVYLVGADPRDPEPNNAAPRCALACSKMSTAAKPPTLAYRIVAEGPEAPARIEWVAGSSDVTADQILAGPAKKGPKMTAAINLLSDELSGGWRLAAEIEQAAANGKISRGTLSRAREILDVQQALVGPVGDKASFRVLWLPRVLGADFDPNKDTVLLAQLRSRQDRLAEGEINKEGRSGALPV